MEAIRLIIVDFSTPCRVVDRLLFSIIQLNSLILNEPEVIIVVIEVEQEVIIFR